MAGQVNRVLIPLAGSISVRGLGRYPNLGLRIGQGTFATRASGTTCDVRIPSNTVNRHWYKRSLAAGTEAPAPASLLPIEHLDVVELPSLRVFSLKRGGHGLPVLGHIHMAG